ncbi:uncharacterized protein EDB91DRAFT_1247159 [Suillus paluster]|uniref:uncharacterized protein n=1 Tax=Suillus paluster TaxID=48578 RepID=UPI001B864AE2|nr:uncharacterized protein EDB91DRAFT_1247159 [Suillus paluster]KAG1743668.1 hypothetical protein EDB91DRAFT_1247159 [Suillus paluster]
MHFWPALQLGYHPLPKAACRDHSALQIPCGYLKCEHYFKTQAGRKKHWNASRPTFISAPTTSISYTATVEDEPEEPHNNFLAGHDDFSTRLFDAGQALDEPDNLDTQFVGPGDRLYRNYHLKLNEMDYQPYREFSTDNDECQWQDFMSGDWAWNQADIISKDPDTTGSTFVPVILGSNKTTVSVATGANDYYPLYVSIGNVRNNVRCAHRDAVAIIGFLAMLKSNLHPTTIVLC